MEDEKHINVGHLHELDPDDVKMFGEIARTSESENERHFFRIMEYRERHNRSAGRDYLLDSNTNPDKIGITREWYDCYMLWIDGDEVFETDTLSYFLNYDLREYICDRTNCHTLLEYLRSIDYSGIDYEGDTD